MENKANRSFFIKDPIHSEIIFKNETAWMHRLIKTSEFLRLKRLQQLGLSSNLFPGASHTRYSHCLGVYELIRRMMNNPTFKKVSDYDKQTLMCAGLLHDLGHGPHSHGFEFYMNNCIDDGQERFNHEVMTAKQILNKHGEIYHILKENDIVPEDVAGLIDKKNPMLKKRPMWMQQLISSELDADRIDYLKRDSYYTGATYGTIDSKLLDRWIVFDPKSKQVGYEKKAITTIESLLIGRYHMYKSVYNNHKSVALERTIALSLKRMIDLIKEGKFDFLGFDIMEQLFDALLINNDINKVDLNQYKYLTDDYFNSFLFQQWSKTQDHILKSLLKNYFVENRFIIWSFDDQLRREEFYNKLKQIIDDNQYFVVKESYKDKTFYSRTTNSLGINIFEQNSKKFHPITDYSKVLNINFPEAFNHLIIFDYDQANKKPRIFRQIENQYNKLTQ
ncbi:HD domain-containing protein [Mycoplasma bradburyae]|uniref:HD domain-containing protein n=1 Tax=Mycoplasma bradburyae TaxID=2963128 RepID=UPI002342734F|nr:HD domain-containing protein [Mycoplasma bradburyae]MDC4183997.1 HD domain-containing protein [Mycoplasma bradburyae]